MLLDAEGAGVERDAEDGDVGEEAGPGAPEGEGEQLGDDLVGRQWGVMGRIDTEIGNSERMRRGN
jgi:hypothetical protein